MVAPQMLGIKHPVILAGMNAVAHADLVAAVSNAGGLGKPFELFAPRPALSTGETCPQLDINPLRSACSPVSSPT